MGAGFRCSQTACEDYGNIEKWSDGQIHRSIFYISTALATGNGGRGKLDISNSCP